MRSARCEKWMKKNFLFHNRMGRVMCASSAIETRVDFGCSNNGDDDAMWDTNQISIQNETKDFVLILFQSNVSAAPSRHRREHLEWLWVKTWRSQVNLNHFSFLWCERDVYARWIRILNHIFPFSIVCLFNWKEIFWYFHSTFASHFRRCRCSLS